MKKAALKEKHRLEVIDAEIKTARIQADKERIARQKEKWEAEKQAKKDEIEAKK